MERILVRCRVGMTTILNLNNLRYFSILILSVFLSSCSRGILVDGNLEQVYEEAKLAFPASSTYFLPNLNAAKLLLFEVSLPHEGHDGKTPNYIHLLMDNTSVKIYRAKS